MESYIDESFPSELHYLKNNLEHYVVPLLKDDEKIILIGKIESIENNFKDIVKKRYDGLRKILFREKQIYHTNYMDQTYKKKSNLDQKGVETIERYFNQLLNSTWLIGNGLDRAKKICDTLGDNYMHVANMIKVQIEYLDSTFEPAVREFADTTMDKLYRLL